MYVLLLLLNKKKILAACGYYKTFTAETKQQGKPTSEAKRCLNYGWGNLLESWCGQVRANTYWLALTDEFISLYDIQQTDNPTKPIVSALANAGMLLIPDLKRTPQ